MNLQSDWADYDNKFINFVNYKIDTRSVLYIF